jgi:hypothetical protein
VISTISRRWQVGHFAAEARALDAAELKDVAPPKRYTLLLSLIARTQVQARDDLAEMFVKRMARIETRARDELALIRERQRETTEMLVGAFADVLEALDGDLVDTEAGQMVKRAVARHGDVRALRASCEAIAAYHGDNYYPLMWRFYRGQRSTLFRLAHTLRFVSTTQDAAVLNALDVLLANEDRTGDLVPATVNLEFASEQWQRTVRVRTDTGPKLARRHFEVCVFAALATALKTGDVAVDGSDAYADYRQQLLPWSVCEPQAPDYCRAVELPSDAAAFVEQLRQWLATTAQRVDAALPSSGQVVIGDKGEPVLKRGPRPAIEIRSGARGCPAGAHARAQHPGHAGQRRALDRLAASLWAALGLRAEARRPDSALHPDPVRLWHDAPDITTWLGLRDRAILATFLGCGLRRAEIAALTFAHVQQRDGAGRWSTCSSKAAAGAAWPCQPGPTSPSTPRRRRPVSPTATSSGPCARATTSIVAPPA